MNKRVLVGIRTNTFNSRNIYLASYYQSLGFDVAFVVDETKGEVSTGFFDKISFDNDRLDHLGLFKSHSKIGWLCGDYFHYMMALDRPQYEGYWLIEDDAFASIKGYPELLIKPLIHEIDFVAHNLDDANGKFLEGWCMSLRNAIDSPEPLLKCLFCVTYSSRRYTLECLKYRQECSRKYISGEIDKYKYPFPNDESLMANIPTRSQFNIQALKDVFPGTCENFNYTSHGEVFDIDPSQTDLEIGFYHPVRLRSSDVDEVESRLFLKMKQKSPSLASDAAETCSWLRSIADSIEGKYSSVD
ncbi:hypothetical protein JNO42_12360 [Pseudomonas putida]|uniref:hypothetical protein n=1 Tax=Pseudomonas TaxID=286 RepID=UPI0006D4564E|nr:MULTISPECIES: hypothetical protein [Pseudomonas]ULL07765.1 hypothetical protein JNO42_12360 [Pseudomonas putida]